MTCNAHTASQSNISDWSFFLPGEEDEILATYIIPHVESVARAHQWLWHEGRCYFGRVPREDDPS